MVRGVRGLAVEQSGAVVAVGTFSPIGTVSGIIFVVHYLADGRLDPGFGAAGRLEIPTPDRVQAFLDGEQRIVVARGIGYQVARYRPDGSPDVTFGDGGISPDPAGVARTGWPQGGVAIQADGSVVLAGFSSAEGYLPITLVRFTSTGQIDTSFGPEGTVTTRVGSEFIGRSDDSANAVAVDADGRIVVAGSSFNGTDDDIAVVRYRGGVGAPITTTSTTTPITTTTTTTATLPPTCTAETVGSHPRLMKIVRAAERRLRAARKQAASVAPDCRERIGVIFDEAVSSISELDGR